MNDEINEEKLDNPLIVHKKTDASYQETASEITMSATHCDDDSDAPTLERHRYKKTKKSGRGLWVIFALIAAVAAVFAALYLNGIVPFNNEEATTATKKSYTTQPENEFKNIITVKGTYIFFEGEEVNGLQGLEKKVKYLDAGTEFTVQDENADSDFLNFQVLSMLSDNGIEYKITHIVSSGLVAEREKATTVTSAAADKSETEAQQASAQ